LNDGEYTGAGRTDSVRVGIVQANLDPWQKWRRDARETIRIYEDLTDSLVRTSRQHIDLVLWPETALPIRLLSPGAVSFRNGIHSMADSLGLSVVTGFPHMMLYRDPAAAPAGAKRIATTGDRYDDFNAAALFQPGKQSVTWYGKMKMVPLAERIPYADMFASFDFLRWGVGIGGWQIGPDSTLFVDEKTGTPFSAMICYESTYPEFVSSFVSRGAEVIAILTIDSWWGRMSGAFQHRQFAVLRAVENRRWIARCALGGFSCFIDPYGRILDQTGLFETAVLARTLPRLRGETFYVRHGEWLAIICVYSSCLLVLIAAVRKLVRSFHGYRHVSR